MNHLPRVVLAVSLAWMSMVATALGQTTAPSTQAALRKATIPLPIKAAPALSPQELDQISKTVAGNIAALLDPNPAVQQSAREALIMDSRGAGPVSPVFSNAYAQAVVTGITSPAIANAKPIRSRLNAAVALARISEAIQNPKLEPAVLMYLADSQPYALRLWGVKAAKGILPELTKANSAQKLLAAVTATAKKYPTGAMTADAYDTLQSRDTAMMNAMLDVIANRVEQYKKGLPEDPFAEVTPFSFFVQLDTWKGTTAPQRLKIMQAFCDVLVLGAYHGDRQPAGPGPREQLQQTVIKACQSLQVAAQDDLLGNKDLDLKAKEAIAAATPSGANLSDAIKEVPAMIRKIKGYEGVSEPKLTPPPSTQPVPVPN